MIENMDKKNDGEITFGFETGIPKEESIENRIGDILDDVKKDVQKCNTQEETPSQTLLKKMFKEGLKTKTEFRDDEVGDLTTLSFVGKCWKLRNVDTFIDIFAELRVSLERQSRIEGFGVVEKEAQARIDNNRPQISFLGGKI